MAWVSAGVLTNPVIDTIMADTGAQTGGPIDVDIIIGGNVAIVVAVELRNAANTANISSQIIAAGIGLPYDVTIPGVVFAAGERLRLRLIAAVTGSVQGSIFAF